MRPVSSVGFGLLAMLATDACAGTIGPDLGAARSFAVLAGSTVTNTGATTVTGDLGVAPGTAVTGFPPGLVISGTMYTGGAAAQAHADVSSAYAALSSAPAGTVLTGLALGGRTLTPGTYTFASSAALTGVLTLDAQGDPNAVFLFQIGSTLTTASNSSIVLANGERGGNVFFDVGSSATLGTGSTFNGTILAQTSITLSTGAMIASGRALARDGAVTLDTNTVTVSASSGPTGTPVGGASSGPTSTPGTPGTPVVGASGGPTGTPVGANNGPFTTIGANDSPGTPVPEPATAGLLAAGVLMTLAGLRLRRSDM